MHHHRLSDFFGLLPCTRWHLAAQGRQRKCRCLCHGSPRSLASATTSVPNIPSVYLSKKSMHLNSIPLSHHCSSHILETSALEALLSRPLARASSSVCPVACTHGHVDTWQLMFNTCEVLTCELASMHVLIPRCISPMAAADASREEH